MKQNKKMVVFGALVVVFFLMELFLYPYLKQLQTDTFVAYTICYAAVVPVLGQLVIAVFLVLLLMRTKLLMPEHYSHKLTIVGMVWYGIYILSAILYFGGLRFQPLYVFFSRMLTLRLQPLWIPAFLVAFGYGKCLTNLQNAFKLKKEADNRMYDNNRKMKQYRP